MADALIVSRSRAIGAWFSFLLTTILYGSFPPPVSFGDVPLQEQDPAVFPSAFEMVLEADRYAPYHPLVDVPVSPRAKDACFSTENHTGPRESNDLRTWNIPPIMACVGLVAAADEIGWAGREAEGDHARSTRNWLEAEQSYTKAIELLTRSTTQDVNLDLASLLNKLGTARFMQKEFAGAETAFRRALTIYTSIKGADDFRVADTLDLLATALFEQKESRSLAGPLFYRAWVIREMVLGPDHPAVAESLHHLAVSLYSDNISVAIPLLHRSGEIREKVFGHDHPLVADSFNAMAQLYERHHRPDLAIPLYQQALTILEKVFGPHASETQQARSNLDSAQALANLREESSLQE